ncbi:MAG TPA: ADP-heptose--LPS heptosyltransferase [Verrucomicrobiales bacterium]|nr:ADP-heptose--LPS heptosyltransferase [Verrucomicrobiales bacterium]
MLTAAVRDLHKCLPGIFQTDVRTSAGAIWEHNPQIVRLVEATDVQEIPCAYPLIHRSNRSPFHFIHGFIQDLGDKLGVKIEPTEFKGDIHLSEDEKRWMSQVQEITKVPVPFWIIGAGGKFDFTAKWWPAERYQQVVDHFAGRILFVQVGEKHLHHPALNGVLDLRGKTNLRQMIRLMHHAQGVLCPVTLHMHLAAAVPVRKGMPKNRPCVVVAGGREPAQWEAYPHHQYLHRNGALPCCDQGGCWKSRVVPLGDKDPKDDPGKLCTHVVHLRDPSRSFRRKSNEPLPSHALPEAPGRVATDYLPQCLDLVTVDDVIRAVGLYFAGGVVKYLDTQQAEAAKAAIFQQKPVEEAEVADSTSVKAACAQNLQMACP